MRSSQAENQYCSKVANKACAWGDVVAALQPFKGELKRVDVDSVRHRATRMAQHLDDLGFFSVVRQCRCFGTATPSKYVNFKAEMYWDFRLRAESGQLAGLTDEPTIAQLVGIRYSHNSRGQVVIESKDDARKRKALNRPP